MFCSKVPIRPLLPPHPFRKSSKGAITNRSQGYPFGWIQAQYGVAILWRAPWLELACNRRYLADCEAFSASCPQEFQKQPHWAVAVSLIGPAGKKVSVCSVHPNWKGPEQLRIAQAQAALSVAQEASSKGGSNPASVPAVICGDFNAVSDAEPRRAPGTEHYAEGPVMHTHLTSAEGGLQDAMTKRPGFAKDPTSSFTFAIPPDRRDEVIDFIFHSCGLVPIGCLQLDYDATMQGRPYLPHAAYPSDHVHLVCDFVFTEEA
eukprot:TRINITY_DN19822_c0_g1_i4.p1 TRINITY_DN19822_c0_g1~~TRINITY_DN19822_c0_g1_i4.p1  ORF type:complete len:261 (-),score=19.60 TRINITY_DN19822_c0_g1_i4:119-901(-)